MSPLPINLEQRLPGGLQVLYLLLHVLPSLYPSVLRHAFGHIPTLTLQKLELVRFSCKV